MRARVRTDLNFRSTNLETAQLALQAAQPLAKAVTPSGKTMERADPPEPSPPGQEGPHEDREQLLGAELSRLAERVHALTERVETVEDEMLKARRDQADTMLLLREDIGRVDEAVSSILRHLGANPTPLPTPTAGCQQTGSRSYAQVAEEQAVNAPAIAAAHLNGSPALRQPAHRQHSNRPNIEHRRSRDKNPPSASDINEAATALLKGTAGDASSSRSLGLADISTIYLQGIKKQRLSKVRANFRKLGIATSDVLNISFLPNDLCELIVKRKAKRYLLSVFADLEIFEITTAHLPPSSPELLTREEWRALDPKTRKIKASELSAKRMRAIADQSKDVTLAALLNEKATRSEAYAQQLQAELQNEQGDHTPELENPNDLNDGDSEHEELPPDVKEALNGMDMDTDNSADTDAPNDADAHSASEYGAPDPTGDTEAPSNPNGNINQNESDWEMLDDPRNDREQDVATGMHDDEPVRDAEQDEVQASSTTMSSTKRRLDTVRQMLYNNKHHKAATDAAATKRSQAKTQQRLDTVLRILSNNKHDKAAADSAAAESS